MVWIVVLDAQAFIIVFVWHTVLRKPPDINYLSTNLLYHYKIGELSHSLWFYVTIDNYWKDQKPNEVANSPVMCPKWIYNKLRCCWFPPSKLCMLRVTYEDAACDVRSYCDWQLTKHRIECCFMTDCAYITMNVMFNSIKWIMYVHIQGAYWVNWCNRRDFKKWFMFSLKPQSHLGYGFTTLSTV